VHVEHRFEHVPQMSEPGAAQIVQGLGDAAPFRDLGVRHRVVLQRAENQVRRAAAQPDGHAEELGHRAEIVVAKLHVGGRALVIHRRERLERREHDRHIEAAQDHADGGRVA